MNNTGLNLNHSMPVTLGPTIAPTWTTGYATTMPTKILSSKMKSFLIRLSEMRENNPTDYDKLVESTANMLIDPLLQQVSNSKPVETANIENTDMLCELMNVNIYEAIIKSFFEDIQEKCKVTGNQTAKETFNPSSVRGYLQVKDNALHIEDLGDYSKWISTDLYHQPITIDNTGLMGVNIDGSGSVCASYSSDTSPTISANLLSTTTPNKDNRVYKLKPYSAIKPSKFTKSSIVSTPHLTTVASVT